MFSISPHRNVWEGYFERPDGEKCRLIFSTTPGETALFTDSYRPPKKSNILSFFESLKGEKVNKAELSKGDRLLSLQFAGAPDLLFQLFGNRANLFYIKNGKIYDSFKNPDKITGQDAPVPRKPKQTGRPPESLNAKQLLLHYDQKLPRHLTDPILDHFRLREAGPDRIHEVVETLTDAMITRPEFRILSSGNLCLVPEDLLPLENLKTFDNINDAIRFGYYHASRQRRFECRMQTFRPGLEKSLQKTQSVLQQLEGADRALERADRYEKYGHLLMARAHEQRDPDVEAIEVTDYYNNNQKTKIQLKENLSIAENAQYYYERSAKARRRVKESKRRAKEVNQQIRKLEDLLESLNRIEDLQELREWEKEHSLQLQELGVLKGASQQKSSRPWRNTQFDGFEIRIGKNAKSNDELTGRAHKEDIWLHARGTGGSHVVIRMNNSNGYPPRHVVLRAASWAAWNSKLRGSKLVPVIVTKRKYVTKPKGAPAGTVRVHREQVEMVPPKKPE